MRDDAPPGGRTGHRLLVRLHPRLMPDAGVLQAAIDRVTTVLATADDDMVAELVSERWALRLELHALHDGDADVFMLDDERARREKR